MNGMLIVKSKVKIDPTFENHTGYIDLSFPSSEFKTFKNIYHRHFDQALFPIEVQDKSESRTRLTTTISMYLVEYGGQDVESFISSLKESFNVVFG